MANVTLSVADCHHIVNPPQQFFLNPTLGSLDNASVADISFSSKFILLYRTCKEKIQQQQLDALKPSCNIGFKEEYGEIHGYVALLICIIGSFTNILNVVILTRKEMINSTNTILTGLAVVDFLLLFEYIGFAASYILGKEQFLEHYAHAAYILFHAHFTQITHTVAICLAITLAVWRYIAICKPHLNLVLCTLPKSRVAVTMAYAVSFAITSPNYFLYAIKAVPDRDLNATHFIVKFSDSSRSHSMMTTIYFYLYGFLIKLLPCILLTFFIYKIIRAMFIAKKRKANLMKNSNPSSNESDSSRKIPQMEKLTDKTTRMLLSVLLLFLVVELPQGVLTLLSAIHGKTFFEQCYMEWGDIMDLLALINSATNFFLYYIMSQQFRVTLKRMLGLSKPRPIQPKCHQGHDTVSTLV